VTGEAPAGRREGDAREDAERRAEELVDRVTHDVGRFLRRTVVRAREELEDVWAEAQAERGRPTTSGRPS
jgi:hypothetical protein